MSFSTRLLARIAGYKTPRAIAMDEGVASDLTNQISFPRKDESRELLSKPTIVDDTSPPPKSADEFRASARNALKQWNLSDGWDIKDDEFLVGHRWQDGGWVPTSALLPSYGFVVVKKGKSNEIHSERLSLGDLGALIADFRVVVQID
jgi:hypothetical protein